MVQTINIEDLTCDLVKNPQSNSICYLIYPQIEGISNGVLETIATTYNVSVAMIYVPADEWNNYLTPWPEPGEAKNCEPFDGKGPLFLAILNNKIVPAVEKIIGIDKETQRDLIGVSLSGLFTFWQWLQSDMFRSIACLSGSFWYSGFMEWFQSRNIPKKVGMAYFLLGEEEPHARIKAYRSVGENTESIVARLKEADIKVRFDWVPGNHFVDALPRLKKALDALYLQNKIPGTEH